MTEKNKDKFNILTQKVDNLKVNVAGLLKQRQRPILDLVFERLESRTQGLTKQHNSENSDSKSLVVVCPGCGTKLPEEINFCPVCGKAVSVRAQQQEKQRKELEIMNSASVEMES